MKTQQNKILRTALFLCASFALLSTSACASKQFETLNPFAEEGPRGLGNSNLKALATEVGGDVTDARHSLETMGSYRSAQAPQPTYPVIEPAEVRLMWVPDHINKAGDLVPAHYYYLKVLDDRWAVQDAFEFNEQLNRGSTGYGTATPWKYGK